MTKRCKTMVMILVNAAFAGVLWLMVCGYLWCWGPFQNMSEIRFRNMPGNAQIYDIAAVEPLSQSPLTDMNICYLGSSVTFGASSMQTSFVEYIAKRNSTGYVKEAVSGTTLVEEGPDNYITRMKKLDTGADFDLFVCQLSTNDATQAKPLGAVTSAGTTQFDTGTICGAMEFIITYARDTWGCPVVFYTNAYYEKNAYAAMVDALYQLQQKYGIGIIDLYTDSAFNQISQQQRALYMADAIHPTKAGYLEWWVPKMEAVLYEITAV